MSSLDSNDLMSMSLPVKKLVKHFKHSFRERDFDEFGKILINRENSFKKEIENLKRNPHMTKQVVTLLDRNGAPVDLDRLLFEELLGKEQRKCQRLKEIVIQLTKEKEKLTDHVKMIDKKRDMHFVENLKMENVKNSLVSELGKSKRKWQEMEVTVTQLTEEKRMLTEDVKMADEKCDMLSVENMKMEKEKNYLISELAKSENKCQELEAVVTLLTVEKMMFADYFKVAEEINQKMENEKNNSISELNGKINELKNQNLESERLAGVYQEKCRCLDNKISKMDQEMGRRKLKSGKVVEELKLANKAIEDLRLQKIMSDKTAEHYKIKLEKSLKRLKVFKENFSKMLTMKVGDMTTLISDVDELGTSEMQLNLDSQGLRGRNEDSSQNANVDVTPPSNGIKNNGLPNKGDGNTVQHLAKEGKQSGRSLKEENNEPKEPLGSGAHLGEKELHSSSRKSARTSPAAARTIIDIIDSEEGIDDAHKFQTSPINQSSHNPTQEEINELKETLGSGAHLTKSARSSTAAARKTVIYIDSDDESETNPDGVTHLVPTSQTSKRSRTNCDEGPLTLKRKRYMCTGDVANSVPTHKKKNHIREPTRIGIGSSVQKLSSASDDDSVDDCLSDSKMNEMVKNFGKKMTYESMMHTIKTDDEFCMSAICALYRQQLSASKSKGLTNSSTNGGFGTSDLVRGCGMAMYLIGGDKELRLSKSVSEVKKHNPLIIGGCRDLAITHAKKLFALHCSAADPFFRRS